VIGNVFFAHAGKGLTGGLTHAGPWAVARSCAFVLCRALPRTAVSAHRAETGSEAEVETAADAETGA
jgi:hypothetical protein